MASGETCLRRQLAGPVLLLLMCRKAIRELGARRSKHAGPYDPERRKGRTKSCVGWVGWCLDMRPDLLQSKPFRTIIQERKGERLVHRGRRSAATHGLPWRGCRANTEKKWARPCSRKQASTRAGGYSNVSHPAWQANGSPVVQVPARHLVAFSFSQASKVPVPCRDDARQEQIQNA